MACAICFKNYSINDTVTVIPCKHQFCEPCIRNWLSKAYKCPLCRTYICDITPKHSDETILLNLSENKYHAGITLKNHWNNVIVVKLSKKDMGWRSGLQVGDIIYSVNSIPCTLGHAEVIELINQATIQNINLNICRKTPTFLLLQKVKNIFT